MYYNIVSLFFRKDRERLHVLLGFGFMLEMTRQEAAEFCRNKIEVIKKRISLLADRSQSIQDHMRELLMTVGELRAASEI